MKTNHLTHKSPSGARSKTFPEINRSEVARRMGCTRSHISKILSGKGRPSVQVLEQMAELMKVPMERLNEAIRVANR
jgi:transcriptional regulator with XRE-family HTH domain